MGRTPTEQWGNKLRPHGARRVAAFAASVLSRPTDTDAWLATVLRPYVGQHLLHFNAEAYNLVGNLAPRRIYVACAPQAEGVQRLQSVAAAGQQHLHLCCADPGQAGALPQRAGGFDTILWVRSGSWRGADGSALHRLRAILAPHGRIVLLLTPNEGARYTPDTAAQATIDLAAAAEEARLALRQRQEFARLETPVRRLDRWCAGVGLAVAPILDRLAGALRPLACHLDPVCPWPGAFVITVLTHQPVHLSAAACNKQGHTNQGR